MEIIKFKDFINNKHYQKYQLNIAIGEFDGVHIAHQELLKQTKLLTSNNELACCLTFEPHPYLIFNHNLKNYLLNSFEDKVKHISDNNIDCLIIIDFNKEFSEISKEDFINNYLLKLNIKNIICGDDFSFGFKGLGKPKDLLLYQDYFKTMIISLKKTNDEIISSSLIRDNLLKGNILKVNALLGYHFSLTGIVIHGREIGRNINFPTANIELNNNLLLIPKSGVYAVNCMINNIKYLGVLNIGHNPTCNYQEEVSIEVHIIDFVGDLYNQTLKLELLDYLREEKRFRNVTELINQISSDKKFVIDNFKSLQ